jgi:hypothetical protein
MHERRAPGSAGHRHPVPPAQGLDGTGLVADELYLLGHGDRSGKPLLQPRALGMGLAAALLAELMLAGWLGLRPDGAVVITRGAPQGAAGRHWLLKQVADEPGPAPVRSWLRFWASSAARDVAVGLEEAGYLTRARSWGPWRPDRWIPVNSDWAFSPVLRIRSVLDASQQPAEAAVVLAGLAEACGLGFHTAQYTPARIRPLPHALAQLAPDLRDLIAQTQTAVDSAVLSQRT